jgi:endonuclease/exonuclease/phosphatase (EEP) superfamily protein YafD
VLLVETSDAWIQALSPLAGEYPHQLTRPRSDNFGVALYSRRALQEADIRMFGAAGVPSVVARIEYRGSPLHILLTHPVPPMSGHNALLRDGQLVAAAVAAQALGPRTILAGDFNTTPWSPVFADVLARSGLRDSAHGFGPQPTWPTTLPWPCRIPIDHCLHSSDLEVVDRRTGADIGSDHLPLIIELR